MIPVCGAESWGGWWLVAAGGRTRFRLGWVLRSRSPDMVRQEIYGCLLAHHAISTLIWQAAAEADIDPDRVSFSPSGSSAGPSAPGGPPRLRAREANERQGNPPRRTAGHNRIFEVSRDVVTARLLWVISCRPARAR